MEGLIRNKDVNGLKELIKRGADVNFIKLGSEPPLKFCVYSNSIECAKILLDAKADVNQVIAGGHTALCMACNFARIDIVKLLIQHKADVLLKGLHGIGKGPLHFAVFSGSLECVKLIINASAFLRT
jgi:ankyrin repeat protein